MAPATVFISHAWEYGFIQTMDVILELALRDMHAYFWLDVFVVNHNKPRSVHPLVWWTTTFIAIIRAIGEVVLVLSPWNKPLALEV